jgi:hypothetical protein
MTTYNFKYSALATTNLLNLTAYGGYYGVAGEGGTVDVSGTSTLITDASANSQEIDDIVAFVNQLSFTEPVTNISGSNITFQPYPARYFINGAVSGTLTFDTSSSSDTFFIFGNYLNLYQITSFILNDANPYNIYFMAIGSGHSIYLAYNTNTPNYGNFIADYVLATSNGEAVGTNCDATVVGTVTGTSTVGTCGGRPFGGITSYLTVNFARKPPTYLFSYVAISNEHISSVILNGGFYGAPLLTNPPFHPMSQYNAQYASELANITDFYNQVTAFLNEVSLTSNVIADGSISYDILPISQNKWNTVTLTSTTTATFNFTGSADDIYYIFNNSSVVMRLDNITFQLNDANPANIYFIGHSIYLSNFTMYGNFITTEKLYKNPQSPPGILNGTTSGILSSIARIVQPTNGSTDIFLTINFTTECFMKGTKILTDHWYVPIEELKVGEMVMSYGVIQDNKFHKVDSPVPQRIVKIRKTVQKASRSSCPVVIVQNAFAPNKPFENLVVSLNHGIVDHKGELYAASNYINKTTIYQDPTIEIITYYHLELAAHCAIMANGVLTESWRESKQ